MINSPDNGSLKNLEDRISKVRDDAGLNEPETTNGGANSGFGMAYRVSIEIVVALAVCTAIGWSLDQLFGWTPWAMLAGLVLGAAAGINNAAKTALKMDAAAMDELTKSRGDKTKEDQAESPSEGDKRGG